VGPGEPGSLVGAVEPHPGDLPVTLPTAQSAARADAEQIWHTMPGDAVVERLGTDADEGLTADEAVRRLDEHGHNEITTQSGPGPWRRLASQFNQPLIYILLVASVVTAALQEWIDSGVILAVVLVNAVIGFIEENRAVKALDALARAMTSHATVLRDGDEHEVDARDLVPGDVVLVRSGDKVPADLRLIRVRSLRTDESALTGEAVPVGKDAEPVAEDEVLADQSSMAFASTVVTFGQARGVVVATGNSTELGQVSGMLAGVEELQTPLTRKIGQFSRTLLFVILVLAAATFLIGTLRGLDTSETFLAAVALAVAAIPEGLPAAMTIVLAIGVGRMAARRAIIRKLPAVETLGSTTVICSDKTGTLTANQMTVTAVLAGGAVHELTGVGYDPRGEIRPASADGSPTPPLVETLRCGLLCNDARLVSTDEEGGWEVHGDPTEGALVVAAHKAGLHAEAEGDLRPRLDAVPFESEHQYMATLHGGGDDGGAAGVAYLKGSVERVMERCDRMMDGTGQLVELDRRDVVEAAERLAAEGRRVLAFARRDVDADVDELEHEDVAEGMTFLGLQGMIDPPRPEAIDAVGACHAAGISVRMITGDHPVTARAIAAQLGITPEGDTTDAVTGSDLSGMNEAQLDEVVRDTMVFARVSPEQKLRLVGALQRGGAVVAMTGDGVNDAPALKQADIGVAMGLKGTDAAKDASDMVLTDDNFASIRAAIEEGRGVFDNLVKFIAWTLPVNLGQALVVITAVVVGRTLPVTPVQILWINMATAILLGLMLAFEPKEPGIMDRLPREQSVPILTPQIITRILLVGGLLVVGAFGLFTYEREIGASLDQARTVAVNTFVIVEMAYLFNSRSLTRRLSEIGWFSNPWIWAGSFAMLAAQLVLTYVPVAQTVFGTAAIGLESWLRIVAVAAVTFAIVSVDRRVRRNREQRAAA
jgi:cation-transporting P-type ATPase F